MAGPNGFAKKRITMPQRIVLFSPYVPKHCGGGEKYFFDVAASLLTQGQDVTVGISGTEPLTESFITETRQRYSKFIQRDLSKLQFVSAPIGTAASWWQKLQWTAQFDVFYYQTDGSLFFSLAKKNILHIQVPLKLDKSGWIERLKLANWQVKNTNSAFTQTVIQDWWQVSIPFVHYPMIQSPAAQLSVKQIQAKKLPVILHVGRFFRQLHCKRQDVLVKAFRELLAKEPALTKGWQLICIGTIEDQTYADEVHQAAAGLPVQFLHSVTHEELHQWYQKASIYWHATGFEVDEAQFPEKMEHFGISTVEAMAAAAAPVVINKGGQKEIMTGELKNWTWLSLPELLSKTTALIQNPDLLETVQRAAKTRSVAYGQAQFDKVLLEMLK
jgi:glycosyltransferase involved in cell wall biosynthesis